MNTHTRTTVQALLASAALLLASACGAGGEGAMDAASDETPPASAPAGGTTTAKPADAQAAGEQGDDEPAAPEELRFSARTLDGTTFNGMSLAGEPAVLWFWAPWCPTCQREAPTIADAASDHGDQVTFVGVAARDEVPAMRDFAAEHGIDSFTNLNDANAAVWARFGVTYQPAFAFIGADGSVEVVKGSLSADELDSRLSAMAS